MARSKEVSASRGKSESTSSQERNNSASQDHGKASAALDDGAEHTSRRRCWACSRMCGRVLRILLYNSILWNMHRSYAWAWAYDWDTLCQHEPLGVNQTGLKVMVAGFAKTGTWGVTVQLREIGFRNTYHSEEFIGHVWTHIAHEFWGRPENGARRPRVIHPFRIPQMVEEEFQRTGVRVVPDLELVARDRIVPKDHPHFPNDDIQVMADLKPEKLAAYVSRCRVESIAFDGIEKLYFPLYEMSPNVKVILLDWRPYDSWKASVMRFGYKWFALTTTTNLMWGAAHGLPWGFFLSLMDPWIGGPIDELLRTGGAFLHYDWDIPIMLWTTQVFQTRVYLHWWSGLMGTLVPEDDYYAFYEEVRRRTPPENLLRWDIRKNTYEELCAFVGIEDCPRTGRSGHIVNINAWDKIPFSETTEPGMLLPLYVFFHSVNWKLYNFVLRAMASACRALSRCARKEAAKWRQSE